MKKVILSALALSVIVMFSCQKEETRIENQSNYENIEKVGTIVIIECTTHRNKYDCASGWGLCDCEFLPNAPWKSRINTNLNDNDKTMVLDSDSFVDNGEQTLYVDENISLKQCGYNTEELYGYTDVIILKGNYTKNINQSVTVNVETVK